MILGHRLYRSGPLSRRTAWLRLIGGPPIIVSGTADQPSDTLHAPSIPELLRGTVGGR